MFGHAHDACQSAWCMSLYFVDDDEIAYFTVRWKTRASFVYRTKNMR